MKQVLNLETWNRRDHFRFFSQFEEPFFGITIQVDVAATYQFSKDRDISFFLLYLYAALRAANETEEFHYRIEEEQVLVHDIIHASPTINRPDGTFGFAYINYHNEFKKFLEGANREISQVQSTTGLIPAISSENVIHFSSIPWVNFTALSHARSFRFKDSIPKISFGKMTTDRYRTTMPISVHVHHGLMDGYHVSLFIDRFQELLFNPSTMAAS